MYYLFGAGLNGISVLSFLGEENVIAVVDNSEAKVGTKLLGVPIISFDQLLEQWSGEKVVIAVYVCSSEIVEQLDKAGIHEYFVCPYMAIGFYSCDKMIDMWDLQQAKSIAVYDRNPISETLVRRIRARNNEIKIAYITENDWQKNEFGEIDTLIITKESCEKKFVSNDIRIVNIYEKMADERKDEYEFLSLFKNCRKGERCFLIGNGPSLQARDLQKIWERKIVSFGCNGITQIFRETDWRPNYYVIMDCLVYEKYKNEIPQKSISFIGNMGNRVKRQGKIYPVFNKTEKYGLGYPTFADDIVTGVYGGRTVMYNMLQIAAYMGFSEIYLLGVDFSWGEDGRNSHFAKDYMDERVVRENIRYKEEQRHAYIAARRYADAHGIKIYNATRGGYLEVFERVDFDSLFDK